MAIAPIPQNLVLQQGNGQVLVTWDQSVGATSYKVQRSVDNVTFSVVATPSVFQYLDTAVTVGTTYYYQVASVNADGTSSYTTSQSIIPTLAGLMTLSQMRDAAKLRADMVNSQFVIDSEWNSYINQSAFELYDLLVTTYQDYYLKPPLTITTDGLNSQFNLPSDFYKMRGVDLGIAGSQNSYVTLKRFNFIERNKNFYPQVTSTVFGVSNLEYDVVGNTLYLTPTPLAGQNLRIWYIPRMPILLADSDMFDGISGWTEYVIVRAAKYALDKEESDTQILVQELQFLKQRIEQSAANRDPGQPYTISNVRRYAGWSGFMGYGDFGGNF